MKRLLKKATAGLLTLALVAGGVPAGTISEKIDSVKEAFVAEAAPVENYIEVGRIYSLEEIFYWSSDGENDYENVYMKIGDDLLYNNDTDKFFVTSRQAYFRTFSPDTEKPGYYKGYLEFRNAGFMQNFHSELGNFVNTSVIKLSVPAPENYPGVVSGIKISGGDGTEKNPFTVELVCLQSGDCGATSSDDVHYSIDGDVLTLSGTGKIKDYFFQNYPIKTVVFSEGSEITEIGQYCFQGSGVESIEFPASLEKIDIRAFYDCSALENLDFSNCTNLKTIDVNAFESCTALSEVDFTGCDNLETISAEAFYKCTALTNVNISKCSKLEKIYYWAFAYTALTSITIPESVILIGEQVFYKTNLTSVNFLGSARLFQKEKYTEYITLFNNASIPVCSEGFPGIFTTDTIGGTEDITYVFPLGSTYKSSSNSSTYKIKQSNANGYNNNLNVKNGSIVKLFTSDFTEDKPTMQVVINDGSKVDVKYFIPLTEGYFSTDSYEVSYGGTIQILSEAPDVSKGNSDVLSGVGFTVKCDAKKIADENSIVIKDKKTGDVLFDNNGATISVASYLKQVLQSSTDTKLSNFVGRMLQYAAAAQQFFNHNTENMANEGTSYPLTFLDAVDGSAFTADQFNEALTAAGINDVSYYALNMSFVSDTTFLLAFKFADDCDTEEEKNAAKTALETFLKSKETGDFVVEYSLDISKNYVIARIEGISLLDLGANIYSFNGFNVKATDYLIKTGAESSSASANMKTLAKALWTFYKAALILAGQS